MYSDWHALLPSDVSLQCVQLPGRQERRAEPAFHDLGPLTEAMLGALSAELDERPYLLFGHCLGAMLAYRLAIAAGEEGIAPVMLGCAAWAPQGFPPLPPEELGRPDAEFAETVVKLGLLPPEVCQDRDTLDFVLPMMRADMSVYGSFTDDGGRVPCPLVTYSGRSDALMAPGAMESWAGRSPRYLGNCAFPGDHFFIREQAVSITGDLVRRARRHLRERAP
jgi:surfactin synthase thioesterase subunit